MSEPTNEERDAQAPPDMELHEVTPPPQEPPTAVVELGTYRQISLAFLSMDGKVVTADLERDVIRFTCNCPTAMGFILTSAQFDAVAAVRAIQSRLPV
jgi:hypothetical protein